MSENTQALQSMDERDLQNKPEATYTGRYYTPPVDIYETPDALHLLADMPGVSAEGIKIDLEDGVLVLHGRQGDVGEEHQGHREFRPGSYLRRFTLSDRIDGGNIAATMKDGVLHLTLPKVPRLKPRTIQVQTV